MSGNNYEKVSDASDVHPVVASDTANGVELRPASRRRATRKIVGTDTDPSGAPIPGATVTATNEGTSEARTIISDNDGDFSFPILPVGNYSIKVVAKCFEGYLQKGIVLQVDQNITVNPQLTVGSNTEVGDLR